MSNPSILFKSLLVYGLCLPVAVFLGYVLAMPLDLGTFIVVGAVFLVLMAPLFLKWYHIWLVASWNMTIVIFLLPGRPQLWIVMTGIGAMIATLQYILNRENRLISVPAITWPLLALALVVIVTANVTGGIGLRVFGSSIYGGKRYILILVSILGYFVIASRRIPLSKANLYAILFFLGTATMVVGSTAGMLPSSFNFLYAVFPVENLGYMSNVMASIMTRSWGLAALSLGVVCAMWAYYGARGILDLQRPHRLIFCATVIFVGLMGGFRSVLIIFILTFGMLLYLEGLLQTRWLPVFVLTLVLGGTLITTFATSLPLSVQRSLAFLPITIDPIAKRDAQASSEWRLRMWQNVLPEIPDNLLLGKGYLFSGTEDWMTHFQGGENTQGSQLVGDYHNGPLSVILPFGLPGVFAFLWFIAAAMRVLFRNMKYGAPELRHLNTFIYAYFVARTIFYLTVFGSLYSDLALFTGLVGLSVSLNGGVAAPEPQEQPQFSFARPTLQPEATQPAPI